MDDYEIFPSGDHIVEPSLAVIILSLVICILGIFGNSVAIFVIVVLKEYQKSITSWYILNLAIADSMFLLTLPFQVSTELNQIWVYPEWLCKAKETILFWNYYASILFLMIMSTDRYIAVCQSYTVFAKWMRKLKSAWLIAASVWITALLFCTPVILYSGLSGIHPECQCTYAFPNTINVNCPENKTEDECEANLERLLQCRPSLNSSHTYSLEPPDQFLKDWEIENQGNDTQFSGNYDGSGDGSGSGDDYDYDRPIKYGCHFHQESTGFLLLLRLNFSIMFILPLVVMVVCYGLIIRKLHTTRVQAGAPTSSSKSGINSLSKKQKKKTVSRSEIDRRRVTIMCAALVGFFFLCWFPYHVVKLTKIVGIRYSQSRVCSMLEAFGNLSIFLNSAGNPYLYTFLGTNFSKRWKSATFTFQRSVFRSSRRRSSSGSCGSLRRNQQKSMDRKPSNTGLTKLSKNSDAKQSSIEGSLPGVRTSATVNQDKFRDVQKS